MFLFIQCDKKVAEFVRNYSILNMLHGHANMIAATAGK